MAPSGQDQHPMGCDQAAVFVKSKPHADNHPSYGHKVTILYYLFFSFYCGAHEVTSS